MMRFSLVTSWTVHRCATVTLRFRREMRSV